MSEQVDSEINSQTGEFLSPTIMDQLLSSLSVVEDPRAAVGKTPIALLVLEIFGVVPCRRNTQGSAGTIQIQQRYFANFLLSTTGGFRVTTRWLLCDHLS